MNTNFKERKKNIVFKLEEASSNFEFKYGMNTND